MLVDDFVMRQIQKIADMCTAIAGAPSGELPEGVFEELDDAYRNLLGMDRDMVASFDTETLMRSVHGPRELDALIDLTLAHAELQARSGDAPGAGRLFDRALAMMDDGDARAEAALTRRAAL